MNIEKLKDRLSEELVGCSGRASLFLEIDGQVIEFNSRNVYQSASLIKLPILYEALRLIEKGTLMQSELVTIGDDTRIGDTGVLQVLSGKNHSIHDLLALMIVVSDNSATNLLIDKIGIEGINASISSLGMENTILQRRMLDFQARQSGLDNFTCAADIAVCLKEGIEGGSLNQHSREIFHSFLLHQQFKDKLPAYSMNEPQLTIGNKTGELPGVEHDCGVISFGKKRAYAAVLIDGLQDTEKGKSTIRQIGKHIHTFITSQSTGNNNY